MSILKALTTNQRRFLTLQNHPPIAPRRIDPWLWAPPFPLSICLRVQMTAQEPILIPVASFRLPLRLGLVHYLNPYHMPDVSHCWSDHNGQPAYLLVVQCHCTAPSRFTPLSLDEIISRSGQGFLLGIFLLCQFLGTSFMLGGEFLAFARFKYLFQLSFRISTVWGLPWS